MHFALRVGAHKFNAPIVKKSGLVLPRWRHFVAIQCVCVWADCCNYLNISARSVLHVCAFLSTEALHECALRIITGRIVSNLYTCVGTHKSRREHIGCLWKVLWIGLIFGKCNEGWDEKKCRSDASIMVSGSSGHTVLQLVPLRNADSCQELPEFLNDNVIPRYLTLCARTEVDVYDFVVLSVL